MIELYVEHLLYLSKSSEQRNAQLETSQIPLLSNNLMVLSCDYYFCDEHSSNTHVHMD